jgi:ABC-type uncharacterized transport system involved in gliding motility auxiliary subunit
LLAEYQQAAGGKLIIERYDPQPDTTAEESAKLDGVEGQELSNGEKFYLGLSVSLLDEKQAIAFLDPSRERQLEYDLSRAIARVMAPDRPVVGIMTPLPIFGMPANPMMQQMGQQPQPAWTLVNELKNDYTVRRIEMDADKIDDDVKVLVLIHPREISDRTQYAVDQYLMRGGKLIAFLDPMPLVDIQQQNPMMGGMPNKGSSLDKLLKAWGLQFDTAKVVADLNFRMQLGGRNGQPSEAPALLSVTSEGLNTNDVVTSQIDSIWLPFAGVFTGTPAPGLQETVLIKTTPASELVDGFLAQLSGDSVMKDFKSSGTNYALALRLTGRFKTAFPEGEPVEKKTADSKTTNTPPAKVAGGLKESSGETTVILVGDADMLSDQFTLRQIQSPFGNLAMQMNGNLNFAQNAVEQLTGDNNLIGIRSRAIQDAPFTRVKKMEAQAEETYQSKIKELEGSLTETRQRLSELQQAKQGNQRYILSPEQEAEITRFQKKEAEVNLQLKQVRKELRHDIDSMEAHVKWVNIAAMPLVVSISGLALAFYKRKRTSAK